MPVNTLLPTLSPQLISPLNPDSISTNQPVHFKVKAKILFCVQWKLFSQPFLSFLLRKNRLSRDNFGSGPQSCSLQITKYLWAGVHLKKQLVIISGVLAGRISPCC